MNRCVVIHRNGTSEVEDVQPAVHKKLRGLDYKRFVVEFVRDKDGVSYRSAVYSKMTPSAWQAGDAVRKLWGRHAGAIRVFDEDGELIPESSNAHAMPGSPPPAAAVHEPRGAASPWTNDVESARSAGDVSELTPEHLAALRAATRVLETSRALDAESFSRLRALADIIEAHVLRDTP